MRLSATSPLARLALALVLAASPAWAQDEGEDEQPWLGQPGLIPPINDINRPRQRQWTSQQLLAWEWDFGYVRREEGAKPMPEKEALLALADRDPRPVLLLRDCPGCKQADHELVVRELQTDRVTLLGRWFHPVKVSNDVLEPGHPFHALFEAKLPPHLLVAAADGGSSSPLATRASPAQLGKLLVGQLRKAYRKDPGAAADRLLELLDEYDVRDAELAQLEDQLAALRREKEPDPREIAKLEARKAVVTAERQKYLEEGKAVDDLGLKEAAPGG